LGKTGKDMKNVMKGIMGFVFSFGLLFTANAQTDSSASTDTSAGPSPDDIVCVQVSENVFECGIIEYPDSLSTDSSARRDDPFKDRPLDSPKSNPYKKNKEGDEENSPIDI
jgi:hypothetical protein